MAAFEKKNKLIRPAAGGPSHGQNVWGFSQGVGHAPDEHLSGNGPFRAFLLSLGSPHRSGWGKSLWIFCFRVSKVFFFFFFFFRFSCIKSSFVKTNLERYTSVV